MKIWDILTRSKQNLPEDATVDQAENHVRRAAEIADQEVSVVFRQGLRLTIAKASTYVKIREELERAVALRPNVPDYRYALAWAKNGTGAAEDPLEDVRKLATDYPDFVEAEGCLAASSLRLSWFSPFDYPAWTTTRQALPPGMVPRDKGLPFTMLRDGCRRAVSFVGTIPRRSLGARFHTDLRTTIRLNFMKTPYATVVGLYVLIDTDPREPFTSEQLINIESYSADPKKETDFSTVGYFLIRLLASQQCTYIVINDPESGVYFNRRVEISGPLASHLAEVAAKVKAIKIQRNEDAATFMKSQQYYFDHFSMDNVRF